MAFALPNTASRDFSAFRFEKLPAKGGDMFFRKRRDKESKPAKSIQQPVRRASEAAAATPKGASAEQPPIQSGEVASAAMPVSHPALSAPLVCVSSIEQLERASGRPATGKLEGGWIQLGNNDGGRTIKSFPAAEGDVFVGTATTVLIDPGSNGYPSRYMFGPIFFDANDNVLAWWKAFNKPAADMSEITASSGAPLGTCSVRLGIRGTYDSKGETGDYVVGFANATLAKVIG